MKPDEKIEKKDVQGLIIKKYRQYLELEKSLSRDTLGAHSANLDKLLNFLSDKDVSILEISLRDLQRFAAGLHDIGIHARSQTRIISGIKSFFYFPIMTDHIEADPNELLEDPKIGFKLSEVLTVEETDHIIPTVDLSKNEGQRSRAILEILYSCGLRVSELANLKLPDLYFNEGFTKIKEKGSKQRLVLISSKTIQEIKYYFVNRNRISIKKDYKDYLFLSRRGTHLSCIMILHLIKELADMASITENISPYTFRHSFTTHPLEGGISLRAIQCVLGHESVSTTEIYTHTDHNMLRGGIMEHYPCNAKYRQEKRHFNKQQSLVWRHLKREIVLNSSGM